MNGYAQGLGDREKIRQKWSNSLSGRHRPKNRTVPAHYDPPHSSPESKPPTMTETDRRVALITGITGQDGSYLAEFLLAKGLYRDTVENREKIGGARSWADAVTEGRSSPISGE